MSTVVVTARWLAVLPAAIVAGVLSMLPIHWIVMLGQLLPGNPDSLLSIWMLPPENLERALNALVVPWVVIVTASKVAPRWHLHVAIGFASLIVVVVVASIWAVTAIDGIEPRGWWFPITLALWLAGSAGAIHHVRG